MRRRKRLSKKSSRRSFKRGATTTKRVNLSDRPMRGGWRI